MSELAEKLYSEFIEAVKRDNGAYNTVLTTGTTKNRFVAELFIKETEREKDIFWWMRYESALPLSTPALYITRNIIFFPSTGAPLPSQIDRFVYRMTSDRRRHLVAVLEDYILHDIAPPEFHNE